MKTAQKLLLLVGLIVLGILLWKLDAGKVWGMVAMVGWGFALILGQEIVAHLFNAAGWKLAYRPRESRAFRYRDLIRYRIIGDGVNYLTPSAQLAGEFARASMLDEKQPIEVRLSGVVVGKVAQALGQACFILLALAIFVSGRVLELAPYEGLIRWIAAGVAALIVFFLIYERFRGPRAQRATPTGGKLWGMPRQFRRFLADHPGRFVLSILSFSGGFAWGAFEIYWGCYFLGIPVDVETALAIECLGGIADAMFFFVPAKAGTQEAGKAAAFALLGLPAAGGLAFGIVRHIRELTWASTGMFLYSRHLSRRRKKKPDGDKPVGEQLKAPART